LVRDHQDYPLHDQELVVPTSSTDNSVKSAFEDIPAVLQTLKVLKMNDNPTADGLLKRMRTFKFVGHS
jgi:hypothetical protein